MGVGGVSFTPALPDTLPVPSSCTCRGSHFSGKHLEARPPAPPGWALGWGPHYLFSSQSAWDADSLRWRHPVCRKINRQLKLGCKSEKTAGLRAADNAGSLLLQQFRAAAARAGPRHRLPSFPHHHAMPALWTACGTPSVTRVFPFLKRPLSAVQN